MYLANKVCCEGWGGVGSGGERRELDSGRSEKVIEVRVRKETEGCNGIAAK